MTSTWRQGSGCRVGQVWKLDARTLWPRGLAVAGPPRPDAFALSPDDRMLATTSAAGITQLWHVVSGRPIGSPLSYGGGAAHAAFSPTAGS